MKSSHKVTKTISQNSIKNRSPEFSWGSIFLTTFGPSILFGIAQGAVLPIIALSAIKLDASYALSGFIASLIGIGVLINNIPAALLTERLGERKVLTGASLFNAFGLFLCLFSHNLWILSCGVLIQGMSLSIFNLARQTYIIHIVPFMLRARAFSIMGGSQRIGFFIGPFLGAATMHFMNFEGAYWISIFMTLTTGLLCYLAPELTNKAFTEEKNYSQPSHQNYMKKKSKYKTLLTTLIIHRHIFSTLGIGVMCLGALRASRTIAIPLWAEYIGLSPTTTALAFGLSAALEMIVFYPAGIIMDNNGRGWIAVPSAFFLGLSFLLLPFTNTALKFTLITLLIGLGNGIGSGIVMTLGADAAPKENKMAFLGIWRVIADSGQSIGPLLLSLTTAIFSLGLGIFTIGLSGLLATWIFTKGLLIRKNN